MSERLMAFICKGCPFCVVARRWPDNRWARFLRAREKNCPFCRAYRRVYGGPQDRVKTDRNDRAK